MLAVTIAGVVFSAPLPAAAHVTIAPSGTVEAGSYTTLTFGVPHGCDGSPTTRVAIQVPEQILSATPTVNPNWRVERVTESFDEPRKDLHGNVVTGRVSTIVYSALTPLPSDLRDAFELSVLVADDADGQELAFPTTQTCEIGEIVWEERSDSLRNLHELEKPAPVVRIASSSPGVETKSAMRPDPVDISLVSLLLASASLLLCGAFAIGQTRRRR